MITIKTQPSIPNPPGSTISALLALQVNGKTILLPGVTYKNCNKDKADIPVSKVGEPASPKSLRKTMAPLKISVWYDLPLAEKKEAIAALLVHFQQNSELVASALDHKPRYLSQLPRLASDEEEYQLALQTRGMVSLEQIKASIAENEAKEHFEALLPLCLSLPLELENDEHLAILFPS